VRGSKAPTRLRGRSPHRGVRGVAPRGKSASGDGKAGASPPNTGHPRAMEVGFEPTHPRIFPDFVLEYAGREKSPSWGFHATHASGHGLFRVKQARPEAVDHLVRAIFDAVGQDHEAGDVPGVGSRLPSLPMPSGASMSSQTRTSPRGKSHQSPTRIRACKPARRS
jgi:hypothetical protein